MYCVVCHVISATYSQNIYPNIFLSHNNFSLNDISSLVCGNSFPFYYPLNIASHSFHELMLPSWIILDASVCDNHLSIYTINIMYYKRVYSFLMNFGKHEIFELNMKHIDVYIYRYGIYMITYG